MTPATATPIERGRGGAAIAHFTQAVTSWTLGLRNSEIRIVVFDRSVTIAHVTQHPTRSFFRFSHRRCYLGTSVRGATTILSAYWAEPFFHLMFSYPIVFGITFHHVVVVVVHPGEASHAD